MKVFRRFLLPVLVYLVVSGCGDDKGTSSQDNLVPSVLVASWTLTSGTVNGVQVPLATMLGWESRTTHAVLVIAAAGTYGYYEKDNDSAVVWQDSGAFGVSGSTFTLSGGQIPIDGGQWSVSGTKLTLTMFESGYTFVILARRPG
jgi:hypothetical protein